MKASYTLVYLSGFFAIGALATPVPAGDEVANLAAREPAPVGAFGWALGNVRNFVVKRNDNSKRDEPVLATTLVASFEDIFDTINDAIAAIRKSATPPLK